MHVFVREMNGWNSMRFVVSAVIAGVLASSGVAAAQVPGQPLVARATYTVEPFSPQTPIMIQGSGVRLRAEPFASQQTQVLSSGSTGLVLNVVGIARMGDWNWYQVVLKSGQKAFIRSDLTSAPSKGGGGPAAPTIAYTPTQPPTPPAYVPAAPPTPAYVPPTYSAPIPIDPQPVQIAPPVNSGGSLELDIPRPSDPPGLQSH